MSPLFEPYFSEYSYGFRPGRSAHDAVLQAQAHVESGKRWMVDMDLEKFFDRVNREKSTAGSPVAKEVPRLLDWARPLVECRSLTHERSLPQALL